MWDGEAHVLCAGPPQGPDGTLMARVGRLPSPDGTFRWSRDDGCRNAPRRRPKSAGWTPARLSVDRLRQTDRQPARTFGARIGENGGMSRVDATGLPRVQVPRTTSGPEAEHGEGPEEGRTRGEGRAGGAEGSTRGRPTGAADRAAPVPETTEADGTTRNAEETKAPEKKPKDGYQQRGDQQAQAGRLKDGAQRPPRAMALLMPETSHFRGQDMKQLAQRFGADLGLLRPDLMPSTLSGKEQANRLWQFFSAYGQAAAGQGSEDGLEVFREALERAGFLRFKDQGTGRNALDRALWSLRAQTPEAARARMASVDLVPMQEEAPLPEGSFRLHHDAPTEQQQATRQPQQGQQPAGHEARPGAEAMLVPVPGQEAQRVNLLAAQAAAAHSLVEEREERLEQDRGRHRGRSGVLGGNMLFNTLHQLRGEGEDSVEAKDRFNRLAFAAVLLLAGATILIVALVSLS